jgi:TetR/AcrR family fatty acid metabolism transcriptional regulator
MSGSEAPKREKEAVIFEAALKTIKQKGFHKARMSDIASEAGISYGLVYHYFRNKEDLFDAIIDHWWDGLFHLMDLLKEQDCPVQEKLKQIIAYFLDTYQRDPELMNVFVTEISRSTANLTQQRLEGFKTFLSLTEALIQEGQKKADLREDLRARYLTYIFLGALEAFVSSMVLADELVKNHSQKQRITDTILEVFLNGARRPGPR